MIDYERNIILAPHGSARREVSLNEVHIPDLWRLGEMLRKMGPNFSFKYPEPTHDVGVHFINGEVLSEAVLKVWHLAHDLKRNLAGDTEPKS